MSVPCELVSKLILLVYKRKKIEHHAEREKEVGDPVAPKESWQE